MPLVRHDVDLGTDFQSDREGAFGIALPVLAAHVDLAPARNGEGPGLDHGQNFSGPRRHESSRGVLAKDHPEDRRQQQDVADEGRQLRQGVQQQVGAERIGEHHGFAVPVLPLQVGGDRIDVCRKPARIGAARKLPADDLQSLGLERRAKTLVQVSTPTRQIIYSLAQSNPLNTLSLENAGPIELGSSTSSMKQRAR